MKIDFRPLTAELVPACRAFNQRMTSQGGAPFGLPEEAHAETVSTGGISKQHFVACDDDGNVRGGVLLMELRGWLGGQTVPLVNIQSPLTEGTADRRFAGIALHLLKFVGQRSPYAYAVGMGGEGNPFARLLAAAGWTITRVPFFFSVLRGGEFLREVGPRRPGAQRLAAKLGAYTGAGAAAFALWRATHRFRRGRYSLAETTQFPDAVQGLWEERRDSVSFAAVRDLAAVEAFYPPNEPRLRRFVLSAGGRSVGWLAARLTPMRDSPFFGNLTVATILDGLAAPEHLEALIALSSEAFADLGGAVLVANHSHSDWARALRSRGFFSGPSNYLLAYSKGIARSLPEGATASIHVNRGDGDGRLNV